MSKRYRVSFGYRTDDGLNYGHPTAWGEVEVEAETESEARLAAIDAAYAQDPLRSHVHPRTVVEVKTDE